MIENFSNIYKGVSKQGFIIQLLLFIKNYIKVIFEQLEMLPNILPEIIQICDNETINKIL